MNYKFYILIGLSLFLNISALKALAYEPEEEIGLEFADLPIEELDVLAPDWPEEVEPEEIISTPSQIDENKFKRKEQ